MSLPETQVVGQGEMATSCIRGGLNWILGKITSMKELQCTGTACPGKWLRHHPWRYLKNLQMQCLGPWFSGGIDSVRLMDGVVDHEGLLQSK